MLALGLDIGTTTVSAAVIDGENRVIDSITRPHHTFHENTPAWERSQNAKELLEIALSVTDSLCQKHTIGVIGITGQQHGIIYLDREGNILSPLYTWQDGRGNLPAQGKTYVQHLQDLTGYRAASGYGLVTHYYNLQNGLVPDNAACICTIHDLAAMTLTGLRRPVTEPSDAHSWGFYDLENDCFDTKALDAMGIDSSILPQVKRQHIVGHTPDGIPVAIPIGDNPASFLGATNGQTDAVLLNIGTGSQICMLTDHWGNVDGLETRPFPLGRFMLTGAALCGGRAWAMTERFFSDVLYALTGNREIVYDKLNQLLDATCDDGSHPRISPTFNGTRSDPDRRATVEGLTPENFTPGHFALGMLHGMIDELHGMYQSYLDAGLPQKGILIGSGNGLRLNPHLQRIAAQTFDQPVHISQCPEEAAVGAAIYAKSILV